MNHLTLKQMHESAGTALPAEIANHVRACPECRSRFDEFNLVDAAMKDMPPEETSPKFTESVMRRLGVGSAPSFAWMLLRNLAPILALAVVSGIAIAALNYFGAFQGSQLGQSTSALQSAYGKLGHQIGEGVGTFNFWLGKYFSFAFAKSSYGLTAFIFCFFGIIALLDKFVFAPMVKKRMIG